ncbi:MAG: hypothetical protein ACR2RF_09075 [Geminicoccaceae bacterium]
MKKDFDRQISLDLSSSELKFKQLYFPCNKMLDAGKWEKALHTYKPKHFGIYIDFRDQVLEDFKLYKLPVIALEKKISKEAVCLVFEKVNTGGVPLSVFELVTASFATENFNLRDDWHGSKLRQAEGRVVTCPLKEVIDATEEALSGRDHQQAA